MVIFNKCCCKAKNIYKSIFGIMNVKAANNIVIINKNHIFLREIRLGEY